MFLFPGTDGCYPMKVDDLYLVKLFQSTGKFQQLFLVK